MNSRLAFRSLFVSALLVLLFQPCRLHADNSISPDVLERVVNATVFVKTERVFQREYFPASGSGFFISPDGYVLTNWHVVADQVSGWLWGREREITAKVLRLTVVVASGTPDEREVPAKVVARNRKLDLALLKTDEHPKDWIATDPIANLHLAEKVWIVGFPYGQLLSALKEPGKREPESNPEVSIGSGMVTSFRHDAKGELAGIQIDATVNPGNSGGPLLNSKGQLAGVVFAKFAGGEGLGLAVPGGHIRRFIDSNLIQIHFSPATVTEPPSPITITARPLLARVTIGGGNVVLEGRDIPQSQAEFTPLDGHTFHATVPFPERKPGISPPSSYLVAVTLKSHDGKTILRRRYRMKRVDNAAATLTSERRPDYMMEDRKIFSGSIRLKDIAGKVHIKKTSDDGTIIDNTRVNRDIECNPTLSNYEALDIPAARHLAIRFDCALMRFELMKKRLEDYRSQLRSSSSPPSSSYHELYDLRDKQSALRKELQSLASQLDSFQVVRCPDGTWYPILKAPCAHLSLSRLWRN